MKRVLGILAAVLTVMMYCVPVMANEQIKVRVGFPQFQGFSYTDENGERSGYGYDLLQMIAPYANFTYEYVWMENYEEMLDMLSRGEIDIIAPVHKTPDREDKFIFTNSGIGKSSIIITTKNSNIRYFAGRPSTYDGMIIGTMEGNSIEADLSQFARRNNFGYVVKRYNNAKALNDALTYGEVDGLATRDFRRLNGEETLLQRFNEESVYIAVKKDSLEIIERINEAISHLDIDNPKWREHLYHRYYDMSSGRTDLSLSLDERIYLIRSEEKPPIRILLNPDAKPYSYTENGKNKGILFDIFDEAAQKFSLKYEVIKTKDTLEYYNLCQQGVADIIVDYPGSVYSAEKNGYNMTDTYFSGLMAVLYRADTKTFKTVAVKKGAEGMTNGYKNLYEGKKLIEFDNIDECVEAVKSGIADAAYMFTYSAAYHVANDYSNIIRYEPVMGTSAHFRMAVKKDADLSLYTLMNKYALSVSDRTIVGLVNRYRIRDEESLLAYIYRNPIKFSIALLITAILLAGSLLGYMTHKRDKKQRLELERAYNEAREASSEAVRANKAKSNFLANMSHDIRTPMNAIVGMTHIAQKNLEDRKRVEDCLKKIDISSGHLLALINDVLDMSKLEGGSMPIITESVDLKRVLDECLTMVSSQAKEMNVSIITHDEQTPERRFVISSSLHLRQIFINIASNGIKYNRPGGILELLYEEKLLDDDTVEFIFRARDNGIGMSEEYLQNVFKPFSQEDAAGSRKSYKGTGLGLSIVKIIVDSMGGTIQVESVKDVGSTFTVKLPLKIDREKEMATENEKDFIMAKADISGSRILLAEDNELNREITRYLLEEEGAIVDEAEDGSVALKKLAEGERYDVIIMDIMMPVMDGLQATKAIRMSEGADYQHIPIIAMTANAFAEDARRCLEAGMNAHIPKPVEPERITQIIRRVMDETPKK